MKNLSQSNTLNILLGINIVIFALALLLQLVFAQGFDTSLFLAFGGFSSINVSHGDLWLLITANFFHIDILHFIFNIYSLAKIGRIVKTFYGDSKLFSVYVLGGLASTLATFLAVKLLGLDPILSLGASGSVFALFGLLIGGTIKKNRFGASLPFNLNDFFLPLILTFSLALIPGIRVNHWAHLGGLAFGIVFGLVFENTIGSIESEKSRTVSDWLFKISVLIVVLSYIALVLNFVNAIFLLF